VVLEDAPLKTKGWAFKAQWLLYVPHSGYCMYRQVRHSIILRAAHTVYLRVLCGSENKQRLLPYSALTDWVSGAFEKFRKATISFVTFVCPSGYSNSAPNERIFVKFDILSIYRKSVEKIQVS
jgi:hypothetical protein